MSQENPKGIDPRVGLCARCKHVKIVESERGSQFLMCMLSKKDPSFRKYPPLPVLACRGYTAQSGATTAEQN